VSLVMMNVILAMATHPDKHKIAHQDKLESVVGSRSPTLKDRDDLPFVRAIIQRDFSLEAAAEDEIGPNRDPGQFLPG
ncbi:hypothetical protein C0991_002891, partial [Blastosporella zonata]